MVLLTLNDKKYFSLSAVLFTPSIGYAGNMVLCVRYMLDLTRITRIRSRPIPVRRTEAQMTPK